jgi:CRP/FNR family transcriptional regulator
MNVPKENARQQSKCQTCPARPSGICGAAKTEALAELDRSSSLKLFNRGETIFSADADASFVSIVVHGVVKLVNTCEDGAEKIVGLLYPTAFYGRMTSERLGLSYEAATDTTICRIDRADFQSITARYPVIERRLLKATMDELDRMRTWVALSSKRTTLQRLATLLAVFASRADPNNYERETEPVKLSLDRRDMADVLGTTVETLCRNMQQLAREKIIEVHGTHSFRVASWTRLIAKTGEAHSSLDRIGKMRPHVDPDNIHL